MEKDSEYKGFVAPSSQLPAFESQPAQLAVCVAYCCLLTAYCLLQPTAYFVLNTASLALYTGDLALALAA